ncbi:hypothetical protein [Paenibacillus sp. FSL R7-0333]|uniref:hypothetical protein n=1 Tax=Paenibacillus sp. FSL R7-0333 TaxID=1926587 RepID=UPI00096FB766|nr:hypothetical protein BK146_15610 [Paenibacillus sp. FSL R7-0333]
MSFKKYKYHLETVSSLIMSPRDHEGLYLAARDFQSEQLVKYISADETDKSAAAKRIKIIYPFYQYGTYSYHPDSTDYYIPGSSIKGALLSNDEGRLAPKLLVDDVPIKGTDLRLTQLQKLQYLSPDNGNATTLAPFFQNVAVEMLPAERKYTGEMFCKEDIHTYLQAAQERTAIKLSQLHVKLAAVLERNEIDEKTKPKVIQLKDNVQIIMERSRERCFLLLGGYKGLSLSGPFKQRDKPVDFGAVDTAVYMDCSSYLPHGIVEISEFREVL